MDVATIKEAFSGTVLWCCLGAVGLMALAGLGVAAWKTPGKIMEVARKRGWLYVVVMGAFMAVATDAGSPTREDKERDRMRREQQAAEDAAWNAALGIGGLEAMGGVDRRLAASLGDTEPSGGLSEGMAAGGLPAPQETTEGTGAVMPSVRSLTESDYAAGLALARIGTDETFDFAPPEGADVHADWTAYGAAKDWFKAHFTNDWSFVLGTNVVDALTVFSYGTARPRMKDRETFISPLETSLGIVPAANWEQLDCGPSQFWQCLTPSNTLVMTWRNALFNRDANNPVSFQMECWPDGCIAFRYDLSRLSDDVVSNLVVGVSNAGEGRVFTALAKNTTSLRWARLDPTRPLDVDPDGDGLTTDEEIFIYGTDPYVADTDLDGLTDGQEIDETHTDPLDAHSLDPRYPDGMAYVIGDLDPFSCPPGSTNTVWEHVFYTGTTNAPFAYPQSTDDTAVLCVTVSGSGSGELIVGEAVIPLLPKPGIMLLAEDDGDSFPQEPTTLRVPIRKGVKLGFWGRIPDSLQVEIDSGSYTIASLPEWHTFGHGWIAFPNTTATTPCIHDLGASSVVVSLDPGDGIRNLSCRWNEASGIEVEQLSGLSAKLTGRFPRNSTTPITYTLAHPDYYRGPKTYEQSARFCPNHSDEEEDDDGEVTGSRVDSEYGEQDEDHACECSMEHPCGNRWCQCGCSCGGVGEDVDEETPEGICREHSCPYADCEDLHASSHTNALAYPLADHVLKLNKTPMDYDAISLTVPPHAVHCCPCPEHWTTNVSLAAKSYNLSVRDLTGRKFTTTDTNCVVHVTGLAPSRDFGDSTVSFCKTGVVFGVRRYTVLGVGISHASYDIDMVNAANPSFGYPIVACSNVATSAEFILRTDVDLPGGDIVLGTSSTNGLVKVYHWNWREDCYDLLLDAAQSTNRVFSIDRWRRMVRDDSGDHSLVVRVAAESPGSVDLTLSYAVEHEGNLYADSASQRLTVIPSPLVADYNHNGQLDPEDYRSYCEGRPFRFWTNGDSVKGDRVDEQGIIGGILNGAANASDLKVNGTYDLLNLFPVVIDLRELNRAWGAKGVSYAIGGDYWSESSLRVTFANVGWDSLRDVQVAPVTNVYNEAMATSTLTRLSDGMIPLGEDVLGRFGTESGVMVAESAHEDDGPIYLRVSLGGKEAFRTRLGIRTRNVRKMFRWINSRHLSEGNESRQTDTDLDGEGPYDVETFKKLIFLHGANVNESQAEIWGEQMFKRLWHTGCNVDFYNVDWRSDIGTDANYHQNASNAFEVASRLVSTIAEIPGEKIIMAHSLGNMVVSSMMQDYGLTNSVQQYIACNSAVPSEAYLAPDDISMRVPQLVHPDWVQYPTNSWASNWHKLFRNDPDDDRKLLGWPGRFRDVKSYLTAVFYSKGDEVLEIFTNNNVQVLSGASSSLGHLAWHKQELFKGRLIGNGLGGTTWAGWNVDENALGVNKISIEAAQEMDRTDPSAFKTNTVFYLNPPSMNQASIPLLVRGAHLTMGIPALTPSVGWTGLLGVLDKNDVLDENDDGETAKIQRPNGWPRRSNYPNSWLHSDMKDMSYFYNHKFYEKVKEKGGLQ
ncbi:MAG: hypothetical protein ACI4RA_05335 [Kiritimatiellia bacterium]